jgi:glycosyltransferase involved in cell wall biosynthesis
VSGQKLRILQVMRAPVGGLFRHVADLTRSLQGMGHSVGLVVDTLANDAQTEARLAALEPHAELGIHRFPMPRLFGKGDLTTPFAVSRLAKQLKVDILHGHGAKGGFYARLALYGGARAKAIYTPHGGVLHFKPDAVSGRLFHQLERTLMGKTSAIIFESTFAEATYSKLIGKPTCTTSVIHNGLAAAEFEPVPAAVDAADFAFVGELRALKGIFPLIEAFAELQRPDGAPVRMVMAGDGPDRAALEAKIAALGLAERVSLLGSRPAREVFALGRCVVVPSLAESLPYIVLEAAAARKRVITTTVGGIPEIFGPLADQLVPPGNAAALSAAMQDFLEAPGASEAVVARLHARVRESFSADHMSARIAALYAGE